MSASSTSLPTPSGDAARGRGADSRARSFLLSRLINPASVNGAGPGLSGAKQDVDGGDTGCGVTSAPKPSTSGASVGVAGVPSMGHAGRLIARLGVLSRERSEGWSSVKGETSPSSPGGVEGVAGRNTLALSRRLNGHGTGVSEPSHSMTSKT